MKTEWRHRIVTPDGGKVFFVTVFRDGLIHIRPSRASDDSAVTVTVDGTYKAALMRKARAETKPRRKPIARGLLSLERRDK